MELRCGRCLQALVCVLILILEMCRTETINVTFIIFDYTYTLDVDSYDRELNCYGENNTTEKEWIDLTHKGHTYSNPINIYDLYEVEKMTGTYELQCLRKNVGSNSYLGIITLNIIEGGHIRVEASGSDQIYTSNGSLTVLENTSLVLTCSAMSGEWKVPPDAPNASAPSFPVLNIPVVKMRDRGIYTCSRVLSEETVFWVELELVVIADSDASGVVGGVDPNVEMPSLTSSYPVIATRVSSSLSSSTIPSRTPVQQLLTSTPTPSSVVSTMSFSSPIVSTTVVFTSIPGPVASTTDIKLAGTSTIPSSATTQLPSSFVPSASLSTPIIMPTSAYLTPKPTPTPHALPTTSTYLIPTSTIPASIITSSSYILQPTSDTLRPTSSVDIPTSTSELHSTTPIIITSTLSSRAVTAEIQQSTSLPSTVHPTSTPVITNIPISTMNPYTIPVALGLLGILILIVCVIIIAVWCCCVCYYRNQVYIAKHENSIWMDEEVSPSSPKSPSEKNIYVPIPSPTPEYDVTEDIFAQEIPQADFKLRMNELWKDELNLLVQEYNALGGSEMRYEIKNAQNPIVKVKNRYRNILPYDRSRVVLKSTPDVPGSDYVNASHIPGILVTKQFISSQGPKENTVNDFWRMVWENKVSSIVMLTKLVEGGKSKCEQYWPERVGDGAHYGAVFVTLVNLHCDKIWVIRDLAVSNSAGEGKLHVRQFQFIGWPDFDAPRYPQDLIRFMHRVKIDIGRDPSPLCVHCSAGVGRSGTFISLFNLTEAINAGHNISIFNVVNEIREYRPHMVQAFPQYRFLYLAVLELLQGDTSMHATNFPIFYQSRSETDSPVLPRQFSELEYQAEKAFTREISRALDQSSINPDPMVLPYDDYLVLLTSPHWDGQMYINASYVDAYDGTHSYIATQLPGSESVRELMQLISQTESPYVILLASAEEFEEMKYDEGRIRYWPEPMTQHEFKGFTLMNENQLLHPLMNGMKLVNSSNGKTTEFTFVTLLDWTDGAGFIVSPDSIQRVVTLLSEVEQSLNKSPDKPIIVQCKDGAGASGVLLSVFNAISQIKDEQSVDVFQTVKRMRYCRPYMVNSLEQYISVHSIINSYLHGTSFEDPGTPSQIPNPFISSL